MQLSVVTKDISCVLITFPSQAKSLSNEAVKETQLLKNCANCFDVSSTNYKKIEALRLRNFLFQQRKFLSWTAYMEQDNACKLSLLSLTRRKYQNSSKKINVEM